MDSWTYQGIELHANEKPTDLFERICRLEATLGLYAGFQAVGTFRAPMSRAAPPRYSPKGQPRHFLHVIWQQDSAQAWAVLLHVAARDRRALLSSYTGIGFLSKDVDFRDGHPRESVLLTAFTADAEDFLEPLSAANQDDPETRAASWKASVEAEVASLRKEGLNAKDLAAAARLAEEHRVRFEYGWYLNSGAWRARYLVQQKGGFMALASAQDSLCTCASKHPEMLQLMMESDRCLHHVAAMLVERLAEAALQSP